ncbi:MAG: hypothetical protein ACRDMV_15310 [Streptosporangiales bacterium]
MLDWFRGKLSAAEVLDYLDNLPLESPYMAAVADDEDIAWGEAEQRSDLPLTDWTPEVKVLVEVRDLLVTLIGITAKVAGGKPPKIPPYPRPVTGAQRARRQQRYEQHQALVRRVLCRG